MNRFARGLQLGAAMAAIGLPGVTLYATGSSGATGDALKVRVWVGEQDRELLLVRVTDTDLYYRLPQLTSDVTASMPLNSINATHFGVVYDEQAVFAAARAREWRQAAAIIIASIAPTLPYLNLNRNDALLPTLEAGRYLMRAAEADARQSTEETMAAGVIRLYERALALFNAASHAEWHPGANMARLRAVMCLAALGRLTDAQEQFQQVREPNVGDVNFGLFWLARAVLDRLEGNVLAACDAASRSSAFEFMNPDVFPDALMLAAECFEVLEDFHRARDIYYEVSRLLTHTEWGDRAVQRLAYIMDNGLADEPEDRRIDRVFFGSEEDINAIVNQFLETWRE